ncbi:MAG: hypothetical protein ABJE95_22145 [Byssovorax sp.]
MHNPFDQLAKKVGKEALDASGLTVVQYEISRNAQHADLRHDPDPARSAERARHGLLGRIAAILCLIEIYGHAPTGAEIRACLGKHFAHWDECERKSRAENKRRKENSLPVELFVEPRLWIIAATVSAPVLRKLEVKTMQGWPAGVHFHGDDLYRVGIVVADQLPCDRSTLLVRIMAAGATLPGAIAELAALPEDAHERAVAEQILLHLRHVIGKNPGRTLEEEEFIVSMQGTWKEARAEGRTEGTAFARAHAVLTVLQARGIAVPDAVRERILAEQDPERLQRWLEKAVVAPSIAEVLDEPS